MIAATVTTPAMVDAIKAARAQHELIVSGAYAHCSCEVEFYFYDRSTQYQEHREERIANAAAAAALAAAEQRADTAEAVLSAVHDALMQGGQTEVIRAQQARFALSSRPVQPDTEQQR